MKISKGIHKYFIILDVFIIIVVSLCIYLSKEIASTSAVYIPKGNINQIISYLDKRNFDISPTIDKYLLIFLGYPQAGWINMHDTKLSKGDFLYRLTKAKAATREIIIYPGETTEIILRNLAKTFHLSYVNLRANYDMNAQYEDGLIIPETYHIPIGISASHLVKYLLNIANTSHEEMSRKIFNNYDPKRWERYLTIASIIQKEAGNEKEMPLVSSVIYNRLKKGMRLQMDGALNYGKYSHVAVTAKRIDDDDSGFNTYKHSGLPPYPVCVVGKSAIKAAIFPRSTNFLYFVRNKKDKNRGHIFTSNFKTHKIKIKEQAKNSKK